MKVGDYPDWHHLVIVADGTKSDFYIDGNHVAWCDQVSKTDISIIGNYLLVVRGFLDSSMMYEYTNVLSTVERFNNSTLSGTQTASLETHTFH